MATEPSLQAAPTTTAAAPVGAVDPSAAVGSATAMDPGAVAHPAIVLDPSMLPHPTTAVDPALGLGFMNFIERADTVALVILGLLMLASVISWYLIFTKTIYNYLVIRRSREFLKFFWNAPSLDTVAAYLDEHKPRDPFSRLAHQGVAASAHHERHGVHRLSETGSAGDFLTRSLRRVIDAQTARAESGLTLLASIGSTAPFIGLLGTVWGIYHALLAIASSGSSGLEQVAGPVGEALIMTAIGLAVAIPAVLGYNFLVRGNRVTLARMDGFAYDLFTFLATGVRLEGQAQKTNGARAPARAPVRDRRPQESGQDLGNFAQPRPVG